jgi:hypothetical protein
MGGVAGECLEPVIFADFGTLGQGWWRSFGWNSAELAWGSALAGRLTFSCFAKKK